MKLAVVTTHPVQYYAPLFKTLSAENITLKVFYTWGEQSINKYDPGFDKIIKWDIPILEGYDFEFLENTASSPGSHHYNGIKNPEAITRIEAFKPDVILVFGWSYHSHLNIMRHFKSKIPVWFRGDSTLLDERGLFKKILRELLLRWVYSYIDKAFHVGSNNRNYFKACGLRDDQLLFAPHAVDNERFSEDRSSEASQLRARLGIGKEHVLILFAGKLEEKKDPTSLLKAVLELKDPQLYLLFVGNGALENQLKNIAANSAANVQFMDFQNQDQMPVIYQACDLFCLPSKGPGETWGLAVNEAMAAGKAVMISDKVGCGVDLVKPGINGEIFLHSNPEDLMKKLSQIISAKKLYEYGRESRRIIQNWSLYKSAQSIVSALKS